MKLQFFLLILPIAMAAVGVKGFNIHNGIQPDTTLIEQKKGDYPTASSQSHFQPQQAVAMFRKRYAVGVESLTTGQTVEIVYKSPNSGRVYVNLENSVNDVVLHVDARYNWRDVRTLVLNTYQYNAWQEQLKLHNFPFPCNGERTTITLQITVWENDYLILANGVNITTFTFRGSLTPDTVTEIVVVLDDTNASTLAELEKVSVSF